MEKYSLQHKKKISFIAALCVLLATSSVFAAERLERPDAGNILKNTQENEIKAPITTPPSITVKEGSTQIPSGGQTVTVSQFHIIGQDIFSEAELTALLADSVGKELTLAELTERTGRISQYFRSHGYLVARAFLPPQESKDGQITIEVVVGKYGQIDIRNKSYLLTPYIQSVVSPLKSSGYIQEKNLERVLLLLSDTSGISLKSTLAPGKEPGTSDLILEVSDTASVTGQVYSDNWGNRFTGDVRGGVNLNINNPGAIGDSIALGGLYTGSGLNNWSVAYSLPTGPNGAKFGVSYSRVSYLLGTETYASLHATGLAKTTSIYETYPLLRSRNANLNLRLSYDHKTLGDQTTGTGTTTDSQKQANAVNIGISGDRRDSAGDGVTSFDFTVTSGHLTMESAYAQEKDTTLQSAGSYTKASLNLLRQKYLNPRLSYSLSLASQLASKNLDSSEKLSLGGASGVRAYPQGEASGDTGYLFTGELRWNMPTPQLQLAAFVDNGYVTLNKSATDSRYLTGAGLGIIYNRPGDYSIRLDYAWKVGSESAQSDTDKSGRLWLRGTKVF